MYSKHATGTYTGSLSSTQGRKAANVERIPRLSYGILELTYLQTKCVSLWWLVCMYDCYFDCAWMLKWNFTSVTGHTEYSFYRRIKISHVHYCCYVFAFADPNAQLFLSIEARKCGRTLAQQLHAYDRPYSSPAILFLFVFVLSFHGLTFDIWPVFMFTDDANRILMHIQWWMRLKGAISMVA